eukprot:967148-Pyramimonas_sp.AAC.1
MTHALSLSDNYSAFWWMFKEVRSHLRNAPGEAQLLERHTGATELQKPGGRRCFPTPPTLEFEGKSEPSGWVGVVWWMVVDVPRALWILRKVSGGSATETARGKRRPLLTTRAHSRT